MSFFLPHITRLYHFSPVVSLTLQEFITLFQNPSPTRAFTPTNKCKEALEPSRNLCATDVGAIMGHGLSLDQQSLLSGK